MIQTDAYSLVLGAVLFQEGPPVIFASCTLTPMEAKYSQIDLEFLEMVFAIVCFKVYLVGKHFTLETDHLSVLGLYHKAIDLLRVRLQWQIVQLQQYD